MMAKYLVEFATTYEIEAEEHLAFVRKARAQAHTLRVLQNKWEVTKDHLQKLMDRL